MRVRVRIRVRVRVRVLDNRIRQQSLVHGVAQALEHPH